jgi:23S rRNA (cytidine1920-2'-O)/16S rRNA (cytidine1409-2'-O)-methyltransferase
LTAQQLPEDARRFHLITIDVSFISLRQILPVLPPLLATRRRRGAPGEAAVRGRREEVGKGGIVRDEGVHKRVVEK